MRRETMKRGRGYKLSRGTPWHPSFIRSALKERPISLVLKYNSDDTAADTESLTVLKAAKKTNGERQEPLKRNRRKNSRYLKKCTCTLV